MKFGAATFARVGITLAVLLVASFLPLIPVEQAPVVRDRIYHSTWASLQDLVGIGIFRMGVSHRATWATLPAMIGLATASLVAGWWLGGRITRRRAPIRQPS
jgi:hypothetical protein